MWDTYRAENLTPLPDAKRATLATAIAETIAAKKAANRRPRYIASLKDYLQAFAKGRETTPVDRITTADIEAWFAGRREAPATRHSNQGRLSALFALCVRRHYCRDNPCRRLDPITVEIKPPAILTPRQSARLLVATRRHVPALLPYMVLGLFAGIRPEELQRLDWSNVDVEHNRATIDAAASKIRRRRIVDLHPTVAAWLRHLAKQTGPIGPAPTMLRRQRRKIRDAAPIPWTQDVLRHTAASYLLAHHKDTQRVCLMMDHSPATLFRHYRNLVTDADCKRFWALVPKTEAAKSMPTVPQAPAKAAKKRATSKPDAKNRTPRKDCRARAGM